MKLLYIIARLAPVLNISVTVLLSETKRTNTAIRWIAKTVKAGGTTMEKDLYKQLSGIIDGTSDLYQKRYLCHKNPNQ